MQTVGDIQIGFIQRQRLNQRSVAGEYFPNMDRRFFIGIKTPRQKGKMRAEFQRHRRGHSAAHTKLARRIVSCTDYPTLDAAAANRNRDIPQRRIVTHLHCGKKAVHINMDYFAHSKPSLITG